MPSEYNRGWLRGYTVALAGLRIWGVGTIYDGVVEESQVEEELIAQARKDGAMRWSGLSGYVRRRKEAHDE